jgi:hypothetical protein
LPKRQLGDIIGELCIAGAVMKENIHVQAILSEVLTQVQPKIQEVLTFFAPVY